MNNVEAWLFLVSRNQYIDYRAVVAPKFICESDESSLLAQAVEGNLTQPGTVLYQEVQGTIVGDLTLIYRVIEATEDNTNILGSPILKDAFGRDIYLIEGIVLKGIQHDFVVTQQDLDSVHQQLVEYYRSFWEVTSPQRAVPSHAFMLQKSENLKSNLKYIKVQPFVTNPGSTLANSNKQLKINISLQLGSEHKFDREITSLAISPRTDLLALRYGYEIIVWSLSRKKILKKFSGLEPAPLSGSPTCVVLDPTGRFLCSAMLDTGERNIIKLWDLDSNDTKGKNLGSYGSLVKMGVSLLKSFFKEEKTSSRVGAVAFSPDSKMVIVGCGDGTIQLWDAKEESIELGTLSGHFSEVNCLAVDFKNWMIASGDARGLIIVWNLKTRQQIKVLQGHRDAINSIAFSPTSHILATGSDDSTIKIWNIKTGQEFEEINWEQSTSVSSVAFSPDGNLIASGSNDGKITLWNLQTKKVASEIQGHNQSVTALAFGADGNLFSSGKDGAVKVWQTV